MTGGVETQAQIGGFAAAVAEGLGGEPPLGEVAEVSIGVLVADSPALALAVAVGAGALAVDEGLPAILDVCHGRAPYECCAPWLR